MGNKKLAEETFVDERQTEIENQGHPAQKVNHRFRASYREEEYPKMRGDIENKEPSMTKQSFQDESDINLIMKRFETTGKLPEMIKGDPQYGDFADVPSYQEAMEIVIHTKTQFEGLPAKVRDRFGNDPERFLAFVENGENAEEMAGMGLLSEEAVARVQKAREAEQEKEFLRRSKEKEKGESNPK